MNNAIADITAWSLRQAALGVGPRRGYYGEEFKKGSYRERLAGQTLANGHKLCYVAFKADLKARKECHYFFRYFKRRLCCDRCLAVQGGSAEPLTYKDMGAGAAHLYTPVSHEVYLRTAQKISPWSAVEGWRLENTAFDFMHNVYLGTARGHIPSTLKALQLLGYWHAPGQTDDVFLKRVTVEMRDTCKRSGPLG